MTNPIFKLIALKNRKEWKQSDDLRDSKHSIPDSVEVIKDISYGPYGKWNLLDVNRPKNCDAGQKLPCIISAHGGGFFYGTKETYQFYAADLANRDFVVINYTYRLAPENNFPAQLEDFNAVLCWVEKNADQYNIDLNRIFFVGDSAGGNLVYHYSTILTNPEYQKNFDFKVPEIRPKAVAMNCGVYEYDAFKIKLLRAAYVKNPARLKNVLDIKKYVTENYPPVFIMSSANDFLLHQMQPMADFLESKKIPVVSKVYGTKEDPQAVHVFHINISYAEAIKCNDDECNFFKSFN